MNSILKLNDRNKGVLIALIATITFSNVYIFSKAALNEVTLAQFLFIWFSFAAFLNLIISWKSGAFKSLKGKGLRKYRIFLYLGIIEIITTTTFYISLKKALFRLNLNYSNLLCKNT